MSTDAIADYRAAVEDFKKKNPDALFAGQDIYCIETQCAGMTLQADIIAHPKRSNFTGLSGERVVRLTAGDIEFETKDWAESGLVFSCACKRVYKTITS